ncbi:MAG: TIGR04282 family arsenosugar biosynthesis glycosyltransferase [Caldimicrobium sp.]
MESIKAIAVFFKVPEKGKVKTRLSKAIGKGLALKIYQWLLRSTIEKVEALEGVDLYAFYKGNFSAQVLKYFHVKRKWRFIPQVGKNLGERLKYAGAFLFSIGYKEVLYIGADSPYIDKLYLSQAFTKLQNYPLVFGPAYDGGYVLVGLRADFKEKLSLLFDGLPYGSAYLLDQTLQRFPESSYYLLPPLGDIDTFMDFLKYLLYLCKRSKATTSI